MPPQKHNKPIKSTIKLSTKDQVLKQLKELESHEAPESKMGAMCYSVGPPPNQALYICPACGEKTLYVDHYAEELSEVSLARQEFEKLIKSVDISIVFDESEFCASCSPHVDSPELTLRINHEDGSSVLSKSITSDDIIILRAFFEGEFCYTTHNDSIYPLKGELRRLRELLVGVVHNRFDKYDEDFTSMYKPLKPTGRRATREETAVFLTRTEEFKKIRDKYEIILNELLEEARQLISEQNLKCTCFDDVDEADASSDNEDDVINNILDILYDNGCQLAEKLREIVSLVRSIDYIYFGKCSSCGQDIDIEQLKSDPHTTYCASCKSDDVDDGCF